VCRLSKQATRDQALLLSKMRSIVFATAIKAVRLQQGCDKGRHSRKVTTCLLVGLASYDMKLHACTLLSRSTSPSNGAVAAMHHLFVE